VVHHRVGLGEVDGDLDLVVKQHVDAAGDP
jgi:hypothetical protein